MTNMPMPTPLIGGCPHCRARLDLPANPAEPMVACPACGRQVAWRSALASGRQFPRNGWKLWGAVTGIILLALVITGYIYRGHVLSALDFVGDVTGGRTTAALTFLGALLILVWLVFWLLFPFAVYFGLRDLRRRTAELDETTRLCVRHLAQLTAERDGQDGPPKRDVTESKSGTGTPQS